MLGLTAGTGETTGGVEGAIAVVGLTVAGVGATTTGVSGEIFGGIGTVAEGDGTSDGFSLVGGVTWGLVALFLRIEQRGVIVL